jgi:hypothetical protein
MELGLNNAFDGGKSITRTIWKGVVGPGNLDFFWPKWHSLRLLLFQNPNKSDFQGPSLSMALEMDLPESNSLLPAPYKQQVH